MWGIGKNTASNLYQLRIDLVYRLSQYDVKALKRIHGFMESSYFITLME